MFFFFFLSKTNINVTMKFFVTKMKRNIFDIIQCLKLLGLSMEKMIIPCFQVAQIMFSIHRLSKNVSLITLFETIDKVFLQAFVGVHKKLVTELLNLKAHLFKLEETKMEFITQIDKLGMAHPARKKELTTKK